MHKPESIQVNEMHKILWDHLILARRPDLVIINKKKENLLSSGFCCPSGPLSEYQRMQKRDKYLDLARELRKLWNMVVTVIPTVIGALGTVPQRLEKKAERVGNQRTNWDYPDNSIVKIGLNNEKSTGDLRRLAVTWTPAKAPQLMLTGKTYKEWKNNNKEIHWGL